MSSVLVVDEVIWDYIKRRFTLPSYHVLKQRGYTHRSRFPCILRYVKTPNSFMFMTTGIPRNLMPKFYDLCPLCWSIDLLIDNYKGFKICNNCGYVLDEHTTVLTSFNEGHGSMFPQFIKESLPRKHTKNIYKRCNHFRNWVLRIQGKEQYRVEPEQLQVIRSQLRKYHIEEFGFSDLRKILKLLKLQHLYNHTYLVLYQLTGNRVIDLEKKHERLLLDLFVKIQEAFSSTCGTRVNMLSYAYLIKKFSELLEWEDLNAEIPPLKSNLKLEQQDKIWKLICNRLQFPYKKSTF